MTNLFPGAVWRPMPGSEKRAARRKGRGVGFHVAVTEKPSIYDINLSTGNDAHLYVRRDGSVEQNVDLDLVAYAGRDGNGSMLWVETQGGTTPADVKSGRWDPPQARTLAAIARYAHDTEGTPLVVMPDARPGSRGIAVHRIGIKHSAGSVPGWWFPGCELWSSALGKECPGDARVAQLPEIVQTALAGTSEEDDMFNDTDRWALNNTMGAVGRVEQRAYGIDALLQKVIAEGANDLTEDEVAAAIQRGVEAGSANVLALVRTTLVEALGEDNTAQADAIVTKLAERLKPAA